MLSTLTLWFLSLCLAAALGLYVVLMALMRRASSPGSTSGHRMATAPNLRVIRPTGRPRTEPGRAVGTRAIAVPERRR